MGVHPILSQCPHPQYNKNTIAGRLLQEDQSQHKNGGAYGTYYTDGSLCIRALFYT